MQDTELGGSRPRSHFTDKKTETRSDATRPSARRALAPGRKASESRREQPEVLQG